ncbi:hypothetical protein KIL84_017662 [Mauremys mutica]|uniref:Uncharacterized protein n=1 Tax=Mauremys mutica TaxID=74926 RepID=A0A9D3X6M2_9SAUR|nr:hypothetical protein KIL84_017662 [Mauremys mutica]
MIVHCKPGHPETQISVECTNITVKGMFISWINGKTKKGGIWGIKITHFHKTIFKGQVTTTVHFSIDAKMGQTFSPLILEVLRQTHSEKELSDAFATTEIQKSY